MAWQIKELAAEPDNLNSIPGTHMAEVGDQMLQAVFWPTHTIVETCMHTHELNKCN